VSSHEYSPSLLHPACAHWIATACRTSKTATGMLRHRRCFEGDWSATRQNKTLEGRCR